MPSMKLVLSITFAAALAACGVARELPLDAGAPATACTTCHGDRSSSGDALARAAPATGAHLAHLGKDVACGSCHVVPESPDHMDGTVQVTFAGKALLHGATPSYDAGTCSNVYCHGTTLGAGGKVPAPSWTAGPLACDACHAAPPPSHAATSTACAGCHPGTVKPDGTIDAANGLHVNGETVAAGAGHAQGFGDPVAARPRGEAGPRLVPGLPRRRLRRGLRRRVLQRLPRRVGLDLELHLLPRHEARGVHGVRPRAGGAAPRVGG